MRQLNFFLNESRNFDANTLVAFSKLDDYDIIGSVKSWMYHPDAVLSSLSQSLINRNLPKVIVQNEAFSAEQIKSFHENCNDKNDARYFVHIGTVENLAYNKDKYPINIKMKEGRIDNIIAVSDHLNLETLTQPVVKHFAYYPK